MKILFSMTVAFFVALSTAQAGWSSLTNEDMVAALLTSQDLQNEKSANALLASMTLRSVNFRELEQGGLDVVLTYSNGGAPCAVRAVVRAASHVTSRSLFLQRDKATISEISTTCAHNLN